MKRNLIEWVVLLVSLAAIVLLVGALVVEGLNEERPPDPRIELHVAQARPASLGWIVPATVSNGGDEAAQAVVIEATTTVGGDEETSELQIDYLPSGTAVEIAFAFSGEPEGDVLTRLVGYQLP